LKLALDPSNKQLFLTDPDHGNNYSTTLCGITQTLVAGKGCQALPEGTFEVNSEVFSCSDDFKVGGWSSFVHYFACPGVSTMMLSVPDEEIVFSSREFKTQITPRNETCPVLSSSGGLDLQMTEMASGLQSREQR